MPFLSTLFALLLPLGGPQPTAATEGDTVRQSDTVEQQLARDVPLSARRPQWTGFIDMSEIPVVRQVRIERRVILRISPRPGSVRRDLMAELPQRAVPTRLVERPMGRCIATSGIVGVSDRGSRLIIYMRDRSMISARLEKACAPRDFYLGFYLERNDDGMLCAERDKLMSRSGAKCEVTQMRRLELVADER